MLSAKQIPLETVYVHKNRGMRIIMKASGFVFVGLISR